MMRMRTFEIAMKRGWYGRATTDGEKLEKLISGSRGNVPDAGRYKIELHHREDGGSSTAVL
jgi:hypothetical protein